MSLKQRINKRMKGTAPDLKEAKKRSKEVSQIIRKDAYIPVEMENFGINKKYYIKTYGCQMNEHDTEVMAGLLEVMGYLVTDDEREADIIILNTCAVRENAENKVFGKLGSLKSLKRDNPEKIFAVCGCMSQEESVVNNILQKYPFVDLIFGTHNIHELPNLIKQSINEKAMIVEVHSQEGNVVENLPKQRANNKKAWVNIIYGCNKFCTYCIVPYTRGKERSRAPIDIIDEINELIANGYKEITLLGQNVNSYANDLDIEYTMANLLEEVAKTGIERIRFTTSNPWNFTEEMVDIIAKYDNIMPYIHLPMQSGNNDILKIMGRINTRESYLELFNLIKEKIPNVAISTDIIVGYPNETDEQFEETLSLFEYCEFDNAYTFIYSKREGTPAASMDDNVDSDIKKERLAKLNILVKKYAKKNNEKYIGKTVKMLVDGPSQKDDTVLAGYTEELKLIHIKGDQSLIGEIVNVKVTDAMSFNLYGELIE